MSVPRGRGRRRRRSVRAARDLAVTTADGGVGWRVRPAETGWAASRMALSCMAACPTKPSWAKAEERRRADNAASGACWQGSQCAPDHKRRAGSLNLGENCNSRRCRADKNSPAVRLTGCAGEAFPLLTPKMETLHDPQTRKDPRCRRGGSRNRRHLRTGAGGCRSYQVLERCWWRLVLLLTRPALPDPLNPLTHGEPQ